jgi:hypothetical protein
VKTRLNYEDIGFQWWYHVPLFKLQFAKRKIFTQFFVERDKYEFCLTYLHRSRIYLTKLTWLKTCWLSPNPKQPHWAVRRGQINLTIFEFYNKSVLYIRSHEMIFFWCRDNMNSSQMSSFPLQIDSYKVTNATSLLPNMTTEYMCSMANLMPYTGYNLTLTCQLGRSMLRSGFNFVPFPRKVGVMLLLA